MKINKINEQFKKYKKWFEALLMKEFLNLPLEKQKEFIVITEKFLQDCHKIHEEAAHIKEKVFQIKVSNILTPTTDSHIEYILVGIVEKNEIKIKFPLSQPKPKIGSTITCVLYSVDNQNWHSSKTKLIEETR